MDQELVAYLDGHFRETSRQIEALRQDTTHQIETLRLEVTEQIRLTRIEIEGLRDQIQLVAEGVASFDEILMNFKGEVRREFEDVRALIRPAYTALHDRVRSVEMWRERTERDPIELIRERFGLGKKPTPSS
jgi:hypothetical protein